MKKSQKQALGISAGVAALAAAATAVYFMTGKNAKNRKKVAKWAQDMRKDVVRELKKANQASQNAYHKAIDVAAKNYRGLKNIDKRELAIAVAELKKHWDLIRSEMAAAGRTVKRITPKAVKSVKRKVKVRKIAKKTHR